MYSIPADLDLRPSRGANLDQICIGIADIQFRFGAGLCVAAQSTVHLISDSRASTWDADGGWSSLEFQRLLNQEIGTASVVSDSLLEFRFGNGFILQLLDDSDEYESMQIYYPGQVLRS